MQSVAKSIRCKFHGGLSVADLNECPSLFQKFWIGFARAPLEVTEEGAGWEEGDDPILHNLPPF